MITVGLGALVVWQLAEVVWRHRGAPIGNRVLRTAVNLAEAALFGVLAWSAASIAASGGAPSKQPSFATVVFGLPGGPFLVGLAGIGLVVAAVRFDAAQPTGLDAGLQAVADQPYGPVVLVVLALGLVAFGVHCFFVARYRKA